MSETHLAANIIKPPQQGLDPILFVEAKFCRSMLAAFADNDTDAGRCNCAKRGFIVTVIANVERAVSFAAIHSVAQCPAFIRRESRSHVNNAMAVLNQRSVQSHKVGIEPALGAIEIFRLAVVQC